MVIDFGEGLFNLRGADAWHEWDDRLADRPMIPGTVLRAPFEDPRHYLAQAMFDNAQLPSLIGDFRPAPSSAENPAYRW